MSAMSPPSRPPTPPAAASVARPAIALPARTVRVAVFAVLALLVAGYAAIVTSNRAEAAGALLSQGRPATASSAENATYAASAAVDGNTATRWSSTFGDPQWIQVDLATSTSICQVVLTWEAAYATAFQIQVSANASTWTTIYRPPPEPAAPRRSTSPVPAVT